MKRSKFSAPKSESPVRSVPAPTTRPLAPRDATPPPAYAALAPTLEAEPEHPVNLLEDPGRFYWKWIVIAIILLALYAAERTIRTGGLF